MRRRRPTPPSSRVAAAPPHPTPPSPRIAATPPHLPGSRRLPFGIASPPPLASPDPLADNIDGAQPRAMFLPGSILAGRHKRSHHRAAAWSPQPWDAGLPQGAARLQPTAASPALRLLPTAPARLHNHRTSSSQVGLHHRGA
ncbi:hypothetical protein VPH35_043862 [Triticum aestivum]